MFNSEFDGLGASPIDFYPQALRQEVNRILDEIYHPSTTGISLWFAASQAAYDTAVTGISSLGNVGKCVVKTAIPLR